ncbi:MAG TPA: nucleoside-diphosphate sugar epimerase/dehydratase [Magnetospirillaceae bacterium]|jgi:O-antigen biosynthesis protein WbqV
MGGKPFPFNRGGVAFVHDLIMTAASLPLSLWLRVGSHAGGGLWDSERLIRGMVVFVAVSAVVFLSLRLYRGVWRYASVDDLVALVRAVSLAIVIFIPILFLVTRLEDFPRSLPIINWFVLIALLGGPRFLYRVAKDRRATRDAAVGNDRRVPVLLAGDGDGAEHFIRAMKSPDAGYRPVAILSPKGNRVGLRIHDVEVLGTLDTLPEAVKHLRTRGQAPERVILTEEHMDGAAVRQLLDAADAAGLTLARLPGLNELKGGVSDASAVAPVAVEDLLGRPQAVLDRSAMRALIRGRRVLVTGAGGSIGSELARQIADAAPAKLALLDSSEFALYTIDREIAGRQSDLWREALIGDVRDRGRMADVMTAFQPELVFHAAALKHVPLVEANPIEGVLTNAVGTRIVADAALAAGVRLMVLISTDKAVNPSSIMGMAKRAAETYCQALDAEANSTRIITVRFGNVLGSTGSVVPLFRQQLTAGGPLTVTHPEMTRYFMTVREAVELVLQASALGEADASWRGRVFVLDMGEPVRIVDLARQMIRLAGKRPDIDVKIEFTGLRPGEKLFEEIFHVAEPPEPTGQQGILAAAARRYERARVVATLDAIEGRCRARDREGMLAALKDLVPEYASVS